VEAKELLICRDAKNQDPRCHSRPASGRRRRQDGVRPERPLLDELKKALAERAPVLHQIMFYPLGQFDGKMKTTDWRKLPIFPVPAGAAGELGGAESDEGLAIFGRPEGVVAVMSPTAVPSANVAMTVAQ
jgi:hypothetical protein